MTPPLPLGHEYLHTFSNGKVLRTQSTTVVAHYRSDARLVTVRVAPIPTRSDEPEQSDVKVWLEGASVMREYVH